MTVGVGQPVVLRFDHPVTSDAARLTVVSHLAVAESVRVPGGWRWVSPTELHFRPEHFWPAGEHILVTSDLDGWDAGDGRWGEGRHSVLFAIGHAHVSTANLATHVMTVTEDGNVVATYPFSGGRDQYPTMNGTHIVMDRQSVVRMISSTNGIPVNSPDGYDELVYSDVHISDSGEYVHAAPWSVASQGRANVSHGCINLSPADALAFFGFSRVGDVVQVVGGPRPPASGDHGVLDWSTSWDQWSPAPIHWLP
jgi:lipoprotein-anchoring transpeptidase ErfK/SrfK